MILCKVGRCPVDGRPICCAYCTKRKNCPNACKSTDSKSCNLSVEIKDKKRAPIRKQK